MGVCLSLLFLEINNLHTNVKLYLPDCFDQLKRLQSVNFNKGHFYGTFPKSICKLTGTPILIPKK